ncbi:CubicO group peptidase (beta-lactamase class C family) [Chryseobacterium sp. 52]|uniref:serine hydrolase n=1 Tax=Chryseobacterium sp. 52 TaxID=2035213 RepID=UPI000C1A384E|nr:serine hydrolase [Chryseobacterium sp. 52]PIF45390.1 CubicO group peptidase (beta-lactamase class C family) [Chryseobacterium sp. 52]
MKNKVSLYITLIIGAMAVPVSAQTKSQLNNEISKVEAGLTPVVRFQGEPLWTIESRMKYYNVPGVSIAVIKNFKVIWSKAYGFADVESKTPATTQTLFQAGSMSKPMSAYAALAEVEAGKIDPDADVNAYLKSWKIPENAFTEKKKVSLKNIVSHTAGLTVSGFFGYEAGKPIPTLVQLLSGQSPSNSPAVFVDKLPGTSYRYGGGGYCVMQQMLIDIEGKDFVTIMNEKILLPLNMKKSTFIQPLPEAQSQWAATAYRADGTKVQGKYHTYPEMAPAGLWTTAEDYAKFVIDIQNTLSNKSHIVISQKMAEEFTTPFIDPFMGLGIFLENKNGQVYFSHGGDNDGFSNKFVGNKTSGDGIVIMTNTNKIPFIQELIRSVASVYEWPNFVAPVNKILPLSKDDFSNIGRYRNNKYGFYKIYRENGKLMTVSNAQTPAELIKIGKDQYALRNEEFTVQFVKNIKTGKKELVEVLYDKTIQSENAQMNDDEKTPLELILDGNFEKGTEAYRKARAQDSSHNFLSENFLNNTGYSLLQQKDLTKAIDIFRLNTLLYPKSENAYDSLGEAYLSAGQKDKARESYLKVLEINPKNGNAISVLKTL